MHPLVRGAISTDYVRYRHRVLDVKNLQSQQGSHTSAQRLVTMTVSPKSDVVEEKVRAGGIIITATVSKPERGRLLIAPIELMAGGVKQIRFPRPCRR